MSPTGRCAFLGFQTLHLPELRRPLYCLGATSLLDRPIIAFAGAHKALPNGDRLRCRSPTAARLAAAGFVVAAVAGTAAGRAFLEGVARHEPIVGMVGDPVTPPFAPPVVAPADTALWLSIFESRKRAALEGIDTEERALGALATAVVVMDSGGVHGAYDVAETAATAGRPVFFTRTAAATWPSRVGTGAHVGTSLGAIVDLLARFAGRV